MFNRKDKLARRLWRFSALLAPILSLAGPAFAQAQRSDSGSDAQDARTDALMATPNLVTPTPQDNLFATTPGLEEQIPAPRFGANILLPFGWDSNPAERAQGGPHVLGDEPERQSLADGADRLKPALHRQRVR